MIKEGIDKTLILIHRWKRVSSMVFLATLLVGNALSCSQVSQEDGKPGDEKSKAANVALQRLHMYISNQSFQVQTADLTVRLDDKVVFAGKLDVGDQHGWKKVELEVQPGEHTIRAYERTTGTTQEKAVNIQGEVWLRIDFFYDGFEKAHKFYMGLSEEPVSFR